ncbi:ABC transporter substrate-binding protein [Mesorhizobium sp. L-8-3]|uniref:ABC transporter substrate-binding protein n=1 Tax=Mesorhizobium sp. L-8-3 TaxID=2744522 RepID=UPI0019260DBF|nr:ABC transporter substrate-binding protein [Mesorhizobium sp. L-8-3]BCH21422.1 peptide ABC transporter substrate-binding protein [Mesorhizobium sp. L-8-3]
MTSCFPLRRSIAAALAVLWCFAVPASAEEPTDIADAVKSGALPPLAERLPEKPRVVDMAALGKTEGQYGGTMRLIMADAKDIRMMTIYGYSRLVVFDKDLNLAPDILESFDVEEGRIFTLHLRRGHKWSDGAPFTAEDFRYFWEDVALNEELSRGGPDQQMLVDGKPPVFEVIDDLTVRYTWDKPNPLFLPSLAGASPNYIQLPAHYMKQFHKRYADPDKLAAVVAEHRSRDWIALHTVKARQYRPENPDLPTLEPWWNTTAPPAERFVFKRNPYFHRVDASGRQLPYVGTVAMTMSSNDLIAAKAGSAESDLQARYLRFDNYTFLKEAEKTRPIRVKLWNDGTGSKVAFLPNLNTNDPVWREIFRKVEFRRALSLGIDRGEINQQFFYGLAHEGANSVLQSSPLYSEKADQAWATFDQDQANALLDEIGLKRNDKGIRMLPDGRPAELIIEFAGDTQETDIVELVREHWGALGLKVYARPFQLDTMRRRFLAGDTLISVWNGLSVGEATPDLPPEEMAPVSGVQGNWPKWGEHTDSGGKAGEPVDLPAAKELLDLYKQWRVSATTEQRREIWEKMLDIFTDQVFTIGTVNGVKQPVVINDKLQNVPEEGVYSFAPTAYFGLYMPDTFWYKE